MAWLGGLVLLALLRARRRGAAVTTSALLALALAPAAHAQASFSRAFSLERFQPQAGAGDIMGVQSTRVSAHLTPSAFLYVSHADSPLRAVWLDNSTVRRTLTLNQTTTTLVASMGMFQRFEVGAALPVVLSRTSGADVIHSALANPAAGGGLGDIRLSGRARLWEVRDFSFAAAVPFTVPTGARNAFMGHAGMTANPMAIAQWVGPRGASVVANAGLLLRRHQVLMNIAVGNAFTYAVGGEVDLWPSQRLAVQLNVGGELAFAGVTREQSPLEALVGLRWLPWRDLHVTIGGGPGLSAGYGTPRYRLVGAVGWTPGW